MNKEGTNRAGNTDPENDPTESVEKVVKDFEGLVTDTSPGLTVEGQHGDNG